MQKSFFIIDVETTGIDPHFGALLSVGIVALDGRFNPIDSMEVDINVPESTLAGLCDKFVTDMHHKSGLWERCTESLLSVDAAQLMIGEFIKSHAPKGRRYLINNSVYFDQHWLSVHMPKVTGLLYRRLIDVSTIHIMLQIFRPEIAKRVEDNKTFGHTAVADCMETLSEFRFYIETLFKKD